MLALIVACSACAAKEPPAVLSALRYPEFMYPIVPFSLSGSPVVVNVDRGWRLLQNGDFVSANREFAAALARAPQFYPAHAGAGYAALAQRDHEHALAGFDAALRAAPAYVPALVGRGQVLLALNRDGEALTAFEAALAADPSLTDLRGRIDVLRFRSVQDLIENARKAAQSGSADDARAAYRRALSASPESAFLYRELAAFERRQGNLPSALELFQRAAELDPSDSTPWIQVGEILEQRGDLPAAEAAFRKANEIEPSPELAQRFAAIEAKSRDAALPAELRAIPAAPQITRGELAALIGMNLDPVLRQAPGGQPVITDTRGHWASAWIAAVARARIIEPFDNHTFQPGAPVRRMDLAAAVSRIVTLLAANRPALRARISERRTITDVGPTHLGYTDVARAVASGVMPLDASGRFDVGRPVSGAEAMDVVAQLRAMADAR